MPYLLYLNPVGGSMDAKKWAKGELSAGRSVVKVSWNNSFLVSNTNAHGGMTNLDTALPKYPGTPEVPTIIIGFSGGAQVIEKWLREKGPTSSIDPSTVKFYLFGSPENQFGSCARNPADDPPKYPGDPAANGTAHTSKCKTPPEFHGGIGIGFSVPPNCAYDVTYVTAQYDGWADGPTDPNNPQLLRIYMGWSFGMWHQMWEMGDLFCYMRLGTYAHSGKSYIARSVNPADPNNRQWTDPANPNVKYLWSMTYPTPHANPTKSSKSKTREADMVERPELELAFTRPVVMPTPDYTNPVNTF